jgi:hypothetical protein
MIPISSHEHDYFVFPYIVYGAVKMVETSTVTQGQVRSRAGWSWLVGILLQPRKTLAKILAADRAVWFPAMLALSVTALTLVLANGFVRQRIGLDNPAQLPEYFQYYTPEQQEQFMQALQATSGNAFVFVLPAMLNLAKVWLGWLIVGSLVYLSLTAVGSGVKSQTAMNLAAWASVPFALLNLVRTVAVISGSHLIQSPGLAGFAPGSAGNGSLFLSALLALINLYWIWHVVLLNLGAVAAGKASIGKTVAAVTFTMLCVLLVQALFGYGMILLGSKVTAVQVFF